MLGMLQNLQGLPVPFDYELQPLEDEDSLWIAGDIQQENIRQRIQLPGECTQGGEAGSGGVLKVGRGWQQIWKGMAWGGWGRLWVEKGKLKAESSRRNKSYFLSYTPNNERELSSEELLYTRLRLLHPYILWTESVRQLQIDAVGRPSNMQKQLGHNSGV